MWYDLFTALALVLIIEGILPFINPDAFKKAVIVILTLDSRDIRMAGLISMIIGLVTLYLVREYA